MLKNWRCNVCKVITDNVSEGVLVATVAAYSTVVVLADGGKTIQIGDCRIISAYACVPWIAV